MAPVARRLSRNWGVLEPLQTARSIEGQVEELRGVLSRHAQVPAVLIGYSWGAWLSLLLAARYPELAGKLILVSSGPFAESGAAELRTRRLDRLDDAEKAEYEAAIAGLSDPAAPDSDRLLEKLGRLAAKADAYAPIVETEPGEVRVDGEIYRAVWREALQVRRSGALLREARLVRCPVVAIHGDSDSSPAAGVAESLSIAQSGDRHEVSQKPRNSSQSPLCGESPLCRLVVLAQCGHTPWLERYAKEEFYRILLSEIG